MKLLIKINLVIFIIVLSILSIGCKSFPIFGKSSNTQATQQQRINNVFKAQSVNTESKLNQVAVLASGTDYAIAKVTNKEPAINVAQDINKRVISLAGKPNLDAEKEIWKTVDQLCSELAYERNKGITALNKKDVEINNLQLETDALLIKKDIEIDKYIKIAQQTALKADTYKASLDEMDKYFGFGAIFYGIKKFIVNSIWILSGGLIVFIILRFASMSNPIAAAIFGILENIISWFIRIINVLFPKALAMAGNVTKKVYNELALVLRKVVDNIQAIREIEKKTGKDITLKEVLIELDKSLDASEKVWIQNIKTNLGY